MCTVFFRRNSSHKNGEFSQNKSMKNFRIFPIYCIIIFISVFALGLVVALPTGTAHATQKESALYSRLTNEIVELYEDDIAHTKVVSDKSEKDIEKLMSKYGFSKKKVQTLLLLADLSNRVGKTKTFAELASMHDRSILKFGKSCIDDYADTLPKEEKDALKTKLLNALKSH